MESRPLFGWRPCRLRHAHLEPASPESPRDPSQRMSKPASYAELPWNESAFGVILGRRTHGQIKILPAETVVRKRPEAMAQQ